MKKGVQIHYFRIGITFQKGIIRKIDDCFGVEVSDLNVR